MSTLGSLMSAAGQKNYELLAHLMESADEVALKKFAESNVGRETLLDAAKDGRNKKIIEILLRHGVNKEAQDIDGGTALMTATFNNNTEAVKMLVDAGAEKTVAKDIASNMDPKFLNKEIIDALCSGT